MGAGAGIDHRAQEYWYKQIHRSGGCCRGSGGCALSNGKWSAQRREENCDPIVLQELGPHSNSHPSHGVRAVVRAVVCVCGRAVARAYVPSCVCAIMRALRGARHSTCLCAVVCACCACCCVCMRVLRRAGFKRVDGPDGCVAACNALPECKYFSHSNSWKDCQLCSSCFWEGSLYSSFNYGSRYTSWQRMPTTASPTLSPTFTPTDRVLSLTPTVHPTRQPTNDTTSSPSKSASTELTIGKVTKSCVSLGGNSYRISWAFTADPYKGAWSGQRTSGILLVPIESFCSISTALHAHWTSQDRFQRRFRASSSSRSLICKRIRSRLSYSEPAAWGRLGSHKK